MNHQLCQAIADRFGRVVVAGPVEATALGNVLVQGRALDLVARTHELVTYLPHSVKAGQLR